MIDSWARCREKVNVADAAAEVIERDSD